MHRSVALLLFWGVNRKKQISNSFVLLILFENFPEWNLKKNIELFATDVKDIVKKLNKKKLS